MKRKEEVDAVFADCVKVKKYLAVFVRTDPTVMVDGFISCKRAEKSTMYRKKYKKAKVEDIFFIVCG